MFRECATGSGQTAVSARPIRRRFLAAIAAALMSIGVVPLVHAADASATTPARVAPVTGGVNLGKSLLSESPAQLSADIRTIAASGAKWLRVDFAWSGIQTQPNKFLWGPTDTVMQTAHATGIN